MAIDNAVLRAIEIAAKAHADQKRKGSGEPYISHPFAVGILLYDAGYSDDVVIAGILHDTVEDTDITLDYIRSEFGENVASIVKGTSEDKSLTWEERKKHTIEYLKTAPTEVRAVSCADKLHNLQSMYNDYNVLGEELWKKFKRGKKEQEWYYRNVAESLIPRGGENLPLHQDLKDAIERLFGR